MFFNKDIKVFFASSVMLLSATAILSAEVITDWENSESKHYESGFHLAIEPVFAIKNGYLGEHVLLKSPSMSSDTNKVPDNQLSYLEWDIKNQLNFGTNLYFDYKKVFFARTGLTFASTQNSGSIEDSDWLNIQSNTLAVYQNYKTNFSKHDNKLNYGFALNLETGFAIDSIPYTRLKPYAGIDFSKIKFSAYDGWYQYGKSDSYGYKEWTTGDKTNSTGNILDYYREQTVFWLGTDFDFSLPADTTLTIGGAAAVYTYTFNRDEHPARSTTFTDICNDYFKAWKFNAAVDKKITAKLSATLKANYFILNLMKGKSYKKTSAGSKYTFIPEQWGGVSAQTLDVSFGLKYSFF